MPEWILLLLLAGVVGAQQPAGVPLEPYRGIAGELLKDVHEGGLVLRSKGERRVVANGDFFLPYVLAAAERTSDREWRATLRQLAAEIRRAGRGRLEPEDPLSPEALAPAAEYPPWEERVRHRLAERRRVALEAETLRDRPESLLAARIHENRENRPAALDAILGFAKAHPERIEEALEAARGYGDGPKITALAVAARAVAKTAPERRPAIDLGIALLYRDEERKERLAHVRKAHPGTGAALLAEEERIADSGGPAYDRALRLQDFADSHGDTAAASAALAEAAFQIASVNSASEDVGVRDRVLFYAGLLERLWSDDRSGGRSAYEAVRCFDAFFLPDGASEEGREALLDTSRMFYANHFLPDALAYPAVTTAESFERRFRSLGADVEAEYARIEGLRPDDAAVKWQRAVYHANRSDTTRALGELGAVEKGWPGTLYGRKALATRAAILYRTGDFRGAAALFDRYVAANPDSAYAWLAALRIGHARLRAGEPDKALAAYAAAEERFPAHELLSFFVPLAKARTLEALGRWADAATEYGRATEAWPRDTLDPFDSSMEWDPPASGPDAPATREAIERRADLLSRPGATEDDRRRFLAAGARAAAGAAAEAAAAFAAFLTERADSPLAPDARERISTLAVAAALDAEDPAERDRLLDLAEESGDDFGDYAAAWVRALILLRTEGGTEPAEALLRAAAAKWWKAQPANPLDTHLAKDVAAVRIAARPPPEETEEKEEPAGDRWRVVQLDIEVTDADGAVRLVRAAPAGDRVLRFTRRQLDEIERVVEKMAGPEEEHAEANRDFLRRVFPIVAGHWGGWYLTTLPRVQWIGFEDAARSTARVQYRESWSSGGWVRVKRTPDGYEIAEELGYWIE